MLLIIAHKAFYNIHKFFLYVQSDSESFFMPEVTKQNLNSQIKNERPTEELVHLGTTIQVIASVQIIAKIQVVAVV